MKRTKILVSFFLIIFILLLNSCSDSDAKIRENNAINVKVEKVRKFDVRESISWSGTIEESESVPLNFAVTGHVEKTLVSEGDYVREGDLLGTLKEGVYIDAKEMSEAALKQAEDAYNRLKPMYDNGNLPEIKLIEVETGLQQARSAASIARRNLEDCRLYAPVNGFIGSKSIEPGMAVAPGLASIEIINISTVYASVSVSEKEISKIKKGQNALISVGALNNSQFGGNVVEAGIVANPLSHTYKIKIAVNNPGHIIKPGMICEVSIDKTVEDDCVVIPNSAVLTDESGRTYVYIISSSTSGAERKYVRTGKFTRDGITITEGLTPDDLVVTAGQHKIDENSTIQIVKDRGEEG